MDWRIAGGTFVLMFIAELGDKTQLMVFARTTGTGKALSVFIGASIALILSTGLAVLVGDRLGYLPDKLVKGVAGAVFILIGLWTLYGIRGLE